MIRTETSLKILTVAAVATAVVTVVLLRRARHPRLITVERARLREDAVAVARMEDEGGHTTSSDPAPRKKKKGARS